MSETQLQVDRDTLTMLHNLMDEHYRNRRSERRWRTVKRGFLALLVVFCAIAYGAIFTDIASLSRPMGESAGVVHIEGPILAGEKNSARNIISRLKDAYRDNRVQGVVLHVDSPGGSATEAERIAREIQYLKAETDKPTIAVIAGLGASAAYLLSVEADRVYASRYSLVGSVGAVLQRWDVHDLGERTGVRQQTYSSGKLKNAFGMFTQPTARERKLGQSLVDRVGGEFASRVRERRGEALSAGRELTTGRVWAGPQALELGLVDGIGTLEAVVREEFDLPMFHYRPSVSPLRKLGFELRDWLMGAGGQSGRIQFIHGTGVAP